PVSICRDASWACVHEVANSAIVSESRSNGGVDAAARIKAPCATPSKLRNTLPPLASNDLLDGVRCNDQSPTNSIYVCTRSSALRTKAINDSRESVAAESLLFGRIDSSS